jgi:DNA polymerase-1
MKHKLNFKQFLVADEGYVLYSIDLSQAENRIVAYIAPEITMIDAFESGIDVHKKTASLIYGVSIDSVTPFQRQFGKRANHGLNYGLGYRRFAFLYEIPENEAFEIVEAYHRAYPGVRQWHRAIEDKLRRDRTLTNCFGRNRLFKGPWGDELLKEAYSFPAQSTTAECINKRGVLYLYYGEDFKHVVLLNQVHDSIVFQIPLSISWDYHWTVLNAVKRNLELPLSWQTREFCIPADVEMGLNLKDTISLVGKDHKWKKDNLYLLNQTYEDLTNPKD